MTVIPLQTAVLLNDTSTKAHIGCRLVVARIIELAAAAGMRVVATASVHTDWRRHEELLGMMRKASIVLVNGEGTLHHSSRQAHCLAAAAPFCRSIGVPVVLLNSVYQENDTSIAENCRSFDRIFVRESQSAHAAQIAGLSAEIVPDLTLSSDVMNEFSTLDRDDTILITDNANKTAAAAAVLAGCKRRDTRFIGLATAEPTNPFLEPVLCPDCTFMDDGAFAVPPPPKHRRSRFLRELRAGLMERHPIKRALAMRKFANALPVDSLLRQLATCRGLVAGRFHAVCLAMLVGTPFASLPSNTIKMKGMLADAGLDRLLHKEAQSAIDSTLSWSDVDHAAVEQYVTRARREAQEMFVEIAGLLK